MGQKRRQYSREFKLDALKLVAEGRSVASVARGLGVHVNTLHGWRAQLAHDPESAFAESDTGREKDEEIRDLKKRLKRAEQERDILKKAAYFANEEGSSPSSTTRATAAARSAWPGSCASRACGRSGRSGFG